MSTKAQLTDQLYAAKEEISTLRAELAESIRSKEITLELEGLNFHREKDGRAYVTIDPGEGDHKMEISHCEGLDIREFLTTWAKECIES